MSSNNVTHEIAVQRLRAAGATIVAEEVAAFLGRRTRDPCRLFFAR